MQPVVGVVLSLSAITAYFYVKLLAVPLYYGVVSTATLSSNSGQEMLRLGVL